MGADVICRFNRLSDRNAVGVLIWALRQAQRPSAVSLKDQGLSNALRERGRMGFALLTIFGVYAEDGEDEDHGDDGEEHSGDGADGEVEPEDFLGAVG